MRTSRILLAFLLAVTLPACGGEPESVVGPDSPPVRDVMEMGGKPHSVETDTTLVLSERGAGFNGSGN